MGEVYRGEGVEMKVDTTVVVDTREQDPFLFPKNPTVRGTLETGDYSILGLEKEIAIERKGVADAVGSVISDRERFEKEIIRSKSLKYFAIVIEGTKDDLKEHVTKEWNIHNTNAIARRKNKGMLIGQLKSCINTYLHWSVKHRVPVFFCKSKIEARMVTEELLRAYSQYKKRNEI